jgi:hypothetical protein
MANAVSLVKGNVGQAAPLGFLNHAVEFNIGEVMPDIIVGSGAPDGDAAPFIGANKGSLYLRTDAADDADAIYQKYDEGGDDDDWAVMSTFSGTLAGTLTVGEDDTGYDVQFFGATSGSYWLWDEDADGVVLVGSHTQTGNMQLTGTLTVGVDDTGHDVKFFGASSGAYMLWDESANELIFATGASIDITADKVMIDFQDGDASAIDPSATAESGWINVNVGGVKKYIPYYAAA